MIYLEEYPLEVYELILTVEVTVEEPEVVRKRDIFGRKRKTKKTKKQKQNWLCFLID